MKKLIVNHLVGSQNIYSIAFKTALRLSELSRSFPQDGLRSLRNRIMQSSSAVCSYLKEAWENKKCEEVFVKKLNDAAIEASETQSSVQSAIKRGYLELGIGEEIDGTYNCVIEEIAKMIKHTKHWTLYNQNETI